jgi:biotin carboxyl carrier protein
LIVSVEVNGKNYLVEIEGADDSPRQVILKGDKIDIDIDPVWTRQFVKSLLVGGNSYRIEFEYEDSGIPKSVWINGSPAKVKINFPGKGKLTGQRIGATVGVSENKIIAPIPGKIVEVKVSEGQAVRQGEVLIVLEAMKMENELASPRDAVVKQILCQEGDNVDLEQILINLG